MKGALIASIVVGLLAVVGAVVVGSMTFEGTVTRDPYETGLRWDEIRKKKAELGWVPVLSQHRYAAGPNRIRFSIRNAVGASVPLKDLVVEAGRTDTSRFDRILESCSPEGEAYACETSFAAPGRWEIRFRWAFEPDRIYFVRHVEVLETRDVATP